MGPLKLLTPLTSEEVSMRKVMLTAVAVLFAFVGVSSVVQAGDAKAKMEGMKGEMKADTEEAKGEMKALKEEAKGNDVKAEMERAKGNVKGTGERAKGKMKEMKAKTE
jgi:hypothetical protein